MVQEDHIGRAHTDITPPTLIQYTVEQYRESPALVKQTNEWLHSIYQHLLEKDNQLQHAQQELKHFRVESLRLQEIEKALEVAKQEVVKKDGQLQLTKQELNQLKEEKLRLQEIEKALEETKQEVIKKDGQLQLTKQELNHLKEGSLKTAVVQHGLSLLAAVSIGVGINFVTSTPLSVAGWLLIFIAMALQSISFYITYSEARKNI